VFHANGCWRWSSRQRWRRPGFAAKDVVVAVGSNFTTLDPYDANDTLSQAVAKSFYQGLFGLDKEMKLQNVLAESYTVRRTAWCTPSSCIPG
jgi:ABC-type transport system substrate-binding protein